MPISFTNLRDGIISVPEDCLRSEEESEAEQKICNRKRWKDSKEEIAEKDTETNTGCNTNAETDKEAIAVDAADKSDTCHSTSQTGTLCRGGRCSD